MTFAHTPRTWGFGISWEPAVMVYDGKNRLLGIVRGDLDHWDLIHSTATIGRIVLAVKLQLVCWSIGVMVRVGSIESTTGREDLQRIGDDLAARLKD